MFGLGINLWLTSRSGSPQSPGLAPVLMVSADLASQTANLDWTASNQTGSPGFGYKVYGGISPSFSLLTTTTGLSYDSTYGSSAGETYSFYVVPFNNVGDGPSSNTASVVLPGESDGPTLTAWGEGGDGSNLGGQFYVAAVNLNWGSVAGATSYSVYRVEDPPPFGAGSYTLLTTTASLSYRDAAVTWPFGPFLGYKVVATNGGASSADSNEIIMESMPPPPPPSSKFLLNSGDGILLNATGALILN